MGFYGLDGYAVKFDTYTGGAPEPENYVAVVAGSQGSAETGFFYSDVIPEMEGAGWFDIEIKFDNGHLQMWGGNQSLGIPLTLVLDGTIPGYVGFDAYFGFTAATGSAACPAECWPCWTSTTAKRPASSRATNVWRAKTPRRARSCARSWR